MTGRSRAAWANVLVSAGIALLVLGPVLLRRGYLLRGDLVFVPDQPWKGAWLGLDGRVPRFVPGDAFLAAAGSLVSGDLVQKTVLLLVFLVGGSGVGRLLAGHRFVARAAGIVLFLWNPWMLERLAIGQWGIVVGYALLPWTVLAAERMRDGGPRGWAGVAFWLGLAAVFSPASGLVALTLVLCVLAARPRAARLAVALGTGLLVNLPWIVPALVTAPASQVPPGQFAAFGPRAESALGLVASLLSLGGIWKASIVPPERTNALVVALSVAIALAAVAGIRSAARSARARVIGLGVAALLAVTLALVTALPAVADLLDDLAAGVPALGIVRDSHRYLGVAALVLAVGLAATVERVREWAVPGREAWRAAAGLLVVAPVLALPSLAWGIGGDWRPVDYPREWFTVRDLVPSGRMVVLPWAGGYRGFDWNDRRAGLDPAPRFFPGDVLIDDRVLVGDEVLDSEDPLLQAVRRALDSGDPAAGLRRLGIRSVLVEKGNGVDPPELDAATVLHDGEGLTLLDLGPVSVEPPGRPSETRQRVVVATDVVVLLTWLTATGLVVARWMRGQNQARCTVRPHPDMRRRP